MLVFGGNWTYLNHVREVLRLTADDMWPLDVPGMPPDVRIDYRITDAGLE